MNKKLLISSAYRAPLCKAIQISLRETILAGSGANQFSSPDDLRLNSDDNDFFDNL